MEHDLPGRAALPASANGDRPGSQDRHHPPSPARPRAVEAGTSGGARTAAPSPVATGGRGYEAGAGTDHRRAPGPRGDDATSPESFGAPLAFAGAVVANPTDHRRRPREDWPSRLWKILSIGPLPALVIAALLATAAGLAGEWVTLRGPTVWTSQTTMLIDQPYGIAVAGDSGLLLKLESVRLKYQGLAATNLIAGPVAQKLGLSAHGVEASTSVGVPPDSLLLYVYGESSSPAIAQNLSAAVATEITRYVQSEDTQYKIPAADQFTIDVVDAATPAAPSGPSHSKAATIGLGLAIVGFAVGFVLTQVVRNRRLVD